MFQCKNPCRPSHLVPWIICSPCLEILKILCSQVWCSFWIAASPLLLGMPKCMEQPPCVWKLEQTLEQVHMIAQVEFATYIWLCFVVSQRITFSCLGSDCHVFSSLFCSAMIAAEVLSLRNSLSTDKCNIYSTQSCKQMLLKRYYWFLLRKKVRRESNIQ